MMLMVMMFINHDDDIHDDYDYDDEDDGDDNDSDDYRAGTSR